MIDETEQVEYTFTQEIVGAMPMPTFCQIYGNIDHINELNDDQLRNCLAYLRLVKKDVSQVKSAIQDELSRRTKEKYERC